VLFDDILFEDKFTEYFKLYYDYDLLDAKKQAKHLMEFLGSNF